MSVVERLPGVELSAPLVEESSVFTGREGLSVLFVEALDAVAEAADRLECLPVTYGRVEDEVDVLRDEVSIPCRIALPFVHSLGCDHHADRITICELDMEPPCSAVEEVVTFIRRERDVRVGRQPTNGRW